MAAGMNSGGIASAGGFGRALAEWIADGNDGNLSPSLSLSLGSATTKILYKISKSLDFKSGLIDF